MRTAANDCIEAGYLAYSVPTTAALVETLLDRGIDGDVAEAETAIDQLAHLPAEDGWAIRDITLLRLRALLARARGDGAGYVTWWLAIATWRNRSASRATWRWLRR